MDFTLWRKALMSRYRVTSCFPPVCTSCPLVLVLVLRCLSLAPTRAILSRASVCSHLLPTPYLGSYFPTLSFSSACLLLLPSPSTPQNSAQIKPLVCFRTASFDTLPKKQKIFQSCNPNPCAPPKEKKHTTTSEYLLKSHSTSIFTMADTAPNGGTILDTTKNSAAAAYDSVTNGPVTQNVKDQSAKTQAEFSNLAASRKTPTTPAATGQPLTHYHSLFSELLSWKNPRASAIAYASIVSFIFALRYLDVIRWGLKLSFMALAITVAAEVIGKVVLSHGLATQMRPRHYWTVSRATVDNMIGDVHELINFFVIEAQRILFVENVGASAAAGIAAFISYHLVKLVPYWGLAIIATTVAFFVPLVYTSNQELIDQHLKNASDAISAQTAQVRSVAQKQADQLATMGKQYAGDYTGKVHEMLRGRGAPAPSGPPKQSIPVAPAKKPEFPTPPTEEPKSTKTAEPEGEVPEEPVIPETEPLVAS